MEREYRNYRRRGSNNREEKSDAITSAVTAQILLCVLALLVAGAVKKFDTPKYAEFKSGYSTMISVPDNEAGGMLGKTASFIQGLFSAKPELPDQEAQREPEPELKMQAEPPVHTETEESAAPAQRKYDYLQPDDEYLSVYGGDMLSEKAPEDASENVIIKDDETALSDESAGAGGLFFADKQDGDETLGAPEGTSLSPVYLSAKIMPPVTGVITSGFGYRKHPSTGNSDFHTGLDVAALEGADIVAALPGTVTETGESEIYGNYIIIEHSNRLKTSYSHCSEIIAQEGMTVRQGERIALVGNTGLTTGPHLHFSVIVSDIYTDPEWVLGPYINTVL